MLATSAADPDLAPFVGIAHLGVAGALAVARERPLLAYTTPMEREEAASTGLALLTPEETDFSRLRRELGEEAAIAHLAARLAEGRVRSGARIAVAGRLPAGWSLELLHRLREQGWDVFSGHQLARRWRKTKTPWQLDDIREAAQGACEALRGAADMLARAEPDEDGVLRLDHHPLTCRDLRRTVAEALARHELEQPEGNIVSAGTDAAVPHSRSNPDRVLRAGETILVDVFPRRKLFADCTRTFVVGTPCDPVRQAFQATLEVLNESHRDAKAGVAARHLHEDASARFEAAGYATLRTNPQTTTGFVHTLGHGVGFELHEEPSFRAAPEDGGRLAPGDVFTLEPGLYDPEAGWGIRLEDLIHLGPDGPENLTPLPYDLNPRAW
ncbi:MAG: M24 family metallopeptidase [Thermoanaerobaculia bacterium]